ncbi:hypothetical protein Psi02_66490 [Planotetraspora silvatica]|uniref:Uncharacterized protein n=1 Tax=Planotetraspora silvatica TaxID=234614 RepID=A0A8J3XRI0_9ACTN|nr:hypothetical protein [Planotetraspora silvatica]GII50225.1 hypothetical protein Psi02_66490 [Planotetraspora silvatica]
MTLIPMLTGTSSIDWSGVSEQLQGWGSLVAAFVAVAALIVTIRTANRDRTEGERQRQEDRADADRRLTDERNAAGALLARQLDQQRERDRRDFLIEQLQRAGDAWSEYSALAHMPQQRVAVQRIQAILPVLPVRFASLLKVRFPASSLDDPQAGAEAERRAKAAGLPLKAVGSTEIFEELADNIREILGEEPRVAIEDDESSAQPDS